MTKQIVLFLALWHSVLLGEDAGKILRPESRAALPLGEVSIIATGPGGRLLLDDQAVAFEQPFPNVFSARTTPSPGRHRLTFIWEGGRSEIDFFVGDHPPGGFKTFREHPPGTVECGRCHALSRKGRLRFTGGCFDCHQQEAFSKIHRHVPEVLEQCGQCHAAHGSTTKAHLILPREQACGLCHTTPGQ
jgi:predicted CXXCH cytochrome family protein